MLTYWLPWPPTQNHLWKTTSIHGKPRTYRTKQYLEFLSFASWTIKAPRPPLAGKVKVSLTFNPPDRRRYDVDNRCKAVLDALTRCGVWQDDSQVAELAARKGPVQKARPGVNIEVVEIGEE